MNNKTYVTLARICKVPGPQTGLALLRMAQSIKEFIASPAYQTLSAIEIKEIQDTYDTLMAIGETLVIIQGVVINDFENLIKNR